MDKPMTDAELIARYHGRVPRYTSYPTAPHFHPGIGAETYAQWLAELPPDAAVSLYIHVPFCDRLCLYCGCNTTVVRNDRPKRAYAVWLSRELDLLADLIGRRAIVTQVHWGGGTPTAMPEDCLTGIMDHVRKRFHLRADAEVAIEIDPTSLTPDCLDALRLMGVNRASLGVQDFDEAVQEAIGRHQSFEETAAAAQALRGLGVTSLNLDLIYGLPHQTTESVARTARQALALKADRAAVFGYAHVPWMKKHQSLIPEAALPGGEARLAQERMIRQVLEHEGGYIPVGLDHYALPGDAMAAAVQEKALHRNFQGYTTDATPVLLGLGASSIGALPQGYVQNATGVPAYEAAINEGRLPVARGVALSADDRLRRAVIERIMCDLELDIPALAKTMGSDPAPLLEDAVPLSGFAADGLVEWDGKRVRVTERGRPFVRNVAALFDVYLKQANAATPRHSAAV
ncbi:oxygen-independent coproporphyrinogen III oxidase [Acidocella aromatica]|uniref:Coproporphyrinogen-III oxidase n=1 Tax=Acidocella aromatica TaxID=1303579 RepID=A0A840VQ81_9PROT|nr:oxygen-independent coproporphyrinogen III oxidase [Acidocella aromatica]MBB5373560.1 oxygen-independent coproporphyrinogen-3 oxidase [Acidocella aromatica]